ncbi:MAG TPA: alpha/beta hydrolase [Nevskia sp.]|nr:alpha/beta hydrolase [Nevskia sp.]
MDATWLDTVVTPWRRARVTRGAGSRTRPDLRFMHLPQASIRYRDSGRGARSIVFCADPPVVLELYDALLRELAPDFRVIVFEMPAYGLSLPRLGLDFSLAGVAQVIADFLRRLALGPALLAFPCVPAYSALWIAGHHPELVSGLVLTQAPDWAQELRWKDGRDPKKILARPYVGQLLLRLLRRSRAGMWYRLALGRRELLEPFTDVTQCSFDHGGGFALASAYQKHLAGPEPDFGIIGQPALAVWGELDRSHAQTQRDSILRYVPGAKLVSLPEAGHFPELEAPQRFAAVVREHFG